MRSLDVAALRADTPGLAGSSTIHLNAAGAALPPACVVECVSSYLATEARCGGYETVDACAAALHKPYTALAQLLDCDASDVSILSSATAAWRAAVSGLLAALPPGATIVAAAAEYGSNAMTLLQAAARVGGRVIFLPDAPNGGLDLPALRAALSTTPAPALLFLTHVPTSSGRVYDAVAAGEAAAAAGVPFILDATQSIGQLPVSLRATRASWLVGTSRKYLRGPRGAAFVASTPEARRRWPPTTIDVWSADWTSERSITPATATGRVYEEYEMSFAAKAGLGAAVEHALSLDSHAVATRIRTLAATARTALTAIPGVAVHDVGPALCGIVSFTVAGVRCADVRAVLAAGTPSIRVHVSTAASTRVDFDARGLSEIVRASFHYYNEESEVDHLAAAVAEIARRVGE